MKGLLLVALFGLATASLLPPIANLKLVENFEGEAVETSTLDATGSTSEDTSSTDTEETTFETTGSTDFDNSTQYTSSTDNSNSTDTLPTTTDITTTTEGSGGDELSDGAIAGIVIGSLAGVGLIIGGVYFMKKKEMLCFG